MEKNKSKEKKTDKWSEEVEQLLKKSGGNIENLEAADRDRLLNLWDKISDEIRKDPSLTEHIHECKPFSQEQKEYLIRASLFLYAQNYVNIVQSVTSQSIGWIDPELNGHYQQTVIAINHLLGLDECKDFPGGFEPFNDNIFPESGILDIGWEYGFADSCVDFLSRAQQFFLDTQTLSGDTSFLQAYVEWLKSKHVSVAKKADEYGKKARQMWRDFEKKHFGTESKTTVDKNINKETTPPKEFVIHEYKKSTKAGQTKKKPGKSKEKKKKFQPWKNSGDACFIIENDRIKFHYQEQIKDLKLKKGSHTLDLLVLLSGASLQPSEIQNKICPDTKNKASKIVNYANELLNKKIAQIGFVDVPTNREFIKRDNFGHYYLSLKIHEKNQFEQLQLQGQLVDDRWQTNNDDESY